MSWVDKVHKKRREEHLARQLTQTESFKEVRDDLYGKALKKSYSSALLLCCDFLFRQHNYKKNGLTKFIKFYAYHCNDAAYDDLFFKELNRAMTIETGIDIQKLFDEVWSKEEANGEK